MKKYIILFFLVVFLSSCVSEPKEDVTEIPEDIQKIEDTRTDLPFVTEEKVTLPLVVEEPVSPEVMKEEIQEIVDAPINRMKSNRPVDSKKYTKKYDLYFAKYSKREFGPNFDWKWIKAQSITESALNPKAKSPVGAQGLMQIMPGTWGEIFGKYKGKLLSVWDPSSNVAGGIYYDARLYKSWKSPRPENDRKAFMFASYNGGLGNPLSSQRLCLKNEERSPFKGYPYCNLWKAAVENAPNVSTWRHEESLHYVDRIMKLMNQTYL